MTPSAPTLVTLDERHRKERRDQRSYERNEDKPKPTTHALEMSRQSNRGKR